ncbi:hypothetical protein DFP73DRAFT_635120 [Morchella snyderi]|nr:hypothetical protein DFP73DRAFT_635120 [Morchella snyderi]
MIVKALGLRGGLDMYMRQNGLHLLRAWHDLRLYLDKRRDTDKITKQTTVFHQEIAELELLVYGFLENWDILSAVGVGTLLEQGWITSRHYDAINERMSVHRKLDHLADGFHRAGDEAELYLDKYWLNKMNVKREMLKRFYNAYSSIWSFLSESYESLRFYCRIKHSRGSMRQHHLQSKTDQEIAHRTRYLVGMTLHSKAEIEKDYYLERIVCLAIEEKLGDLSIAVGCFREAIEDNIKMRIHQLEEEQSRQENMKRLHRRFKLEYDSISQYIQNTQSTQATEPCQRFKARFPRYQDFWDKGIQTIHWVLDGNPPGTLVQALSSISVSTAMAFVLDEVGETCRMQGEVIADIGIWGKEIRSTSERLFFEQICKDIWVRNSADEGFDYDYSESGYTPQYRDSLKDLAKYLVTHSRGLYQPPSALKENLCLNDDSPGFQNSGQGSSLQCPISPNEIPLGDILHNESIPIAGKLEISPPIEFMPENIIYMPYADIPFSIPPFQPTLSVPETNAALDLCLNIMASAVFTAIIIFLHFMSRGPRRFQDIVQNELFNPLIGDNRFDCFEGVFDAALAKVKSGCLTGFYNVVDFIRLNAHFSFPDRLYDQKLFCLQEKTKDLLFKRVYHVVYANIGLQCAECEINPPQMAMEPHDGILDETSDTEELQASLEDNSQSVYTRPGVDADTGTVNPGRPRTYIGRKRKAPPSVERPSEPTQRPKKQAVGNNFTCDECGEKYSNRGNLNRHIREKHALVEEKPKFRCEFSACDQTFTRLYARDKHHREIHLSPLSGGEGDAGLPPRHLLVAKGYMRSREMG